MIDVELAEHLFKSNRVDDCLVGRVVASATAEQSNWSRAHKTYTSIHLPLIVAQHRWSSNRGPRSLEGLKGPSSIEPFHSPCIL
uniref:SFRICE_038729 n=1 Tax=Spodoptera frugiperda TaxID=7108 RepID=A0A2H1WXW5_SPOFR